MTLLVGCSARLKARPEPVDGAAPCRMRFTIEDIEDIKIEKRINPPNYEVACTLISAYFFLRSVRSSWIFAFSDLLMG